MEYMAQKMDDLITNGIQMKNDMDENFDREVGRLILFADRLGTHGGQEQAFRAIAILNVLGQATKAVDDKDDKEMYRVYLLMKGIRER